LKFFFDNNLSPLLAGSVAELSKHEADVECVTHLRTMFDAALTKDIEWLDALANSGEAWYVISQDKFKKDQRAERQAISRAGHTVYVLDPQWSSHPFWPKAARLTLWWPHILDSSRRISGGVFRVPWGYTSQARFKAM
jgi:hypothetical protein